MKLKEYAEKIDAMAADLTASCLDEAPRHVGIVALVLRGIAMEMRIPDFVGTAHQILVKNEHPRQHENWSSLLSMRCPPSKPDEPDKPPAETPNEPYEEQLVSISMALGKIQEDIFTHDHHHASDNVRDAIRLITDAAWRLAANQPAKAPA